MKNKLKNKKIYRSKTKEAPPVQMTPFYILALIKPLVKLSLIVLTNFSPLLYNQLLLFQPDPGCFLT